MNIVINGSTLFIHSVCSDKFFRVVKSCHPINHRFILVLTKVLSPLQFDLLSQMVNFIHSVFRDYKYRPVIIVLNLHSVHVGSV